MRPLSLRPEDDFGATAEKTEKYRKLKARDDWLAIGLAARMACRGRNAISNSSKS